MKNISIDEPCSEDWGKMTPTQKGAFCQKCSIDVHDFTQKTPEQVKEILRANKGKHMCGHFGVEQLEMLNNDDYTYWQGQTRRTFQSKFLCALVLVFGMTLFSCSKDEQNFIEELGRAKTEITTDVASLSSIDNFANDIHAATLANHMMDMPAPVEDIVWEMQVDGGISWNESWVDLAREEVVDVHRETLLGAMRVQHVEIARELLLPVEETTETLLAPEILNEVDPFETKLFPNPTRDNASLVVFVKETSQFDIMLYNMSGQLVRQIHRGELQEGEQRFDIELYDFDPGMYLTQIISGDQAETVKIQKL